MPVWPILQLILKIWDEVNPGWYSCKIVLITTCNIRGYIFTECYDTILKTKTKKNDTIVLTVHQTWYVTFQSDVLVQGCGHIHLTPKHATSHEIEMKTQTECCIQFAFNVRDLRLTWIILPRVYRLLSNVWEYVIYTNTIDRCGNHIAIKSYFYIWNVVCISYSYLARYIADQT